MIKYLNLFKSYRGFSAETYVENSSLMLYPTTAFNISVSMFSCSFRCHIKSSVVMRKCSLRGATLCLWVCVLVYLPCSCEDLNVYSRKRETIALELIFSVLSLLLLVGKKKGSYITQLRAKHHWCIVGDIPRADAPWTCEKGVSHLLPGALSPVPGGPIILCVCPKVSKLNT